jgi:hypothetical protein
VHAAGFAATDTDPRRVAARETAGNRCWSATANDPRFARLRLVDPLAVERQLRAAGFKAWRCTERAGYERTSAIPLSGPGGYPLQLAAGNFRVGPTDGELERFYRVAARCSRKPLSSFRWSDGRFSRDPADGTTRCVRHDHGGLLHGHACFTANAYPDR